MSRVLVVDDEAPILRALTANLRARKYEWDAAATGEDALRLAARHHPDAVVLDLGLPGMSGIEVIRGLRGWTAVPIIVPAAVSVATPASGDESSLGPTSLAMPKSRILMRPSFVTNRLSGFTSRCTMPLSWAAASPSAICRA